MDGTLAVIAVCAFVGYLVLSRIRDPLRHVPGPREIPLLGSALHVDFSTLYQQLTDWSKLYGPIIKFSLFGQTVIAVSSEDCAKEVLVKHGQDFAGRPPYYRARRAAFFKSVGLESYTNQVMEKKKFMHHALATHGSGMGRLESVMMEEMVELLDEIARKQGQPFDTLKITTPFFCNVVATLMYGEHYSYDDPIVEHMLEINDAIVGISSFTNEGRALDALPWLRFTGLFRKGLEELRRVEIIRDNFLLRKVKEARATLDPNNPRGLIDELLLTRDPEAKFSFQWDDEHLTGVSNDLVTGGISTSLRTMQAAYLILLKYPHIQNKIQDEIDTVIGRRPPSHSHRGNMPYTEAFTLELLRYTSMLPLLIPHQTMNKATLKGYEIPKNCMVIINAWAIHHDENVYQNPHEFNPNRFLDSEGKLHSHEHPTRTHFLAFGAGRRVCPGENLARARLFLTVVSILQRFKLVEDESNPVPNPDPRTYKQGGMLDPPSCFVKALPRE